MENVFEGAKFGDKFVIRDGRVAVYIIESDFGYPGFNCYACAVEGEAELYHYDYSGECIRGIKFYNENDHIPFDIVSHYQESIDEEDTEKHESDNITNLDDSIKEFENTTNIHCNEFGCYYWDDIIEGFKSGYKKALDNALELFYLRLNERYPDDFHGQFVDDIGNEVIK